jgi:hypothetical protein
MAAMKSAKMKIIIESENIENGIENGENKEKRRENSARRKQRKQREISIMACGNISVEKINQYGGNGEMA